MAFGISHDRGIDEAQIVALVSGRRMDRKRADRAGWKSLYAKSSSLHLRP